MISLSHDCFALVVVLVLSHAGPGVHVYFYSADPAETEVSLNVVEDEHVKETSEVSRQSEVGHEVQQVRHRSSRVMSVCQCFCTCGHIL